jgi:hypothetical protein
LLAALAGRIYQDAPQQNAAPLASKGQISPVRATVASAVTKSRARRAVLLSLGAALCGTALLALAIRRQASLVEVIVYGAFAVVMTLSCALNIRAWLAVRRHAG